jgi:hypothetical protein
MAKPKKSEFDVALEMYEAVIQSNDKQKRLRSSTFWKLFYVKAKHKSVVEKVESLLDKQGLKIAVKSGEVFGKEPKDDWIILTPKLFPELKPRIDLISVMWPSEEWFEMIQTRDFESEREVEAYFIAPLLEKLGYEYNDIAIGFPVEMFKGTQRTTTEADFVIFNSSNREKENVLLVIEAKKSDKGISVDHVRQANSYAKELLPACYIVSNGQQIMVYQFNALLAPDDRIMDFDRSQLKEKWEELYNCVSKKAAIDRKKWMIGQVQVH